MRIGLHAKHFFSVLLLRTRRKCTYKALLWNAMRKTSATFIVPYANSPGWIIIVLICSLSCVLSSNSKFLFWWAPILVGVRWLMSLSEFSSENTSNHSDTRLQNSSLCTIKKKTFFPIAVRQKLAQKEVKVWIFRGCLQTSSYGIFLVIELCFRATIVRDVEL